MRRILLSLLPLLVACGGEAAEEAAPEVPKAAAVRVATETAPAPGPAVPTPKEVAALKIRIEPTPATPGLGRAMLTALAGSGYTVGFDRHGSWDLVGQVTASIVTGVRDQGNGAVRTAPRYVVTLSLLAGGRLVDQASTEFDTNEAVSPSRLLPIVATLSASPNLTQFARDRHARQVAKTEKAEETASTSERVDEETVWNAARVTGCKLPASLTGCDAVRLYLAKYPAGGHVDEANKALAAGQPQLEKLQKDENAWQQAGANTCRARNGTDPCVGIELYLTKYPAGLHADEAHALLNPSAPVAPPAPPPPGPRARIQECCTALRARAETYVMERSFLVIAAEQCDRVVPSGDATALRQRLAGHAMPPGCQGL
jgi:hypothetical protein